MINNPKSHWWYRLSQVFYTIFVILLIVAGIISIVASFPDFSVYRSTYQLKCFKGEIRGSFLGSELSYSQSDLSDDDTKKMARFACARTDLTGNEFTSAYLKALQSEKMVSGYIPASDRTNTELSQIPKIKNYEIELKEKGYYGSWWDPIIAFIVVPIVIFLMSSLVRAMYLYIVFGQSFWSTFMLKSRKNIDVSV